MNHLYPINKHETAQAGRVLATAFENDPVFSAIFSHASSEHRIAYFTSYVVYCHKYGQVVAASAQLEGIAAWARGEFVEMKHRRMILSGAIWHELKVGRKNIRKCATVFKSVDQDRKDHMRARDYIYLQLVGVTPQYQGQGFGGELIKAVIMESERSGLPIYLETETNENVRLYQHFGFTVLKEVTLPVIDLPMWEMIREPAG